MDRFSRRFGWLIGLIVGFLWLAWAGLWDQYAYTRPDAPNPAAGRIHPLNVHGKNVYLNSHEHYVLNALMISPWIIIGGSILANLITKKRGGRSESTRPKRAPRDGRSRLHERHAVGVRQPVAIAREPHVERGQQEDAHQQHRHQSAHDHDREGTLRV